MSKPKTRVLTDQNGHTLRVIDNEFYALQAERDALMAQNNSLRIALDDILEDMQVGVELNAEDCALWKTKIRLLFSKSPEQCLAAHDAEVAAKAVDVYAVKLCGDLYKGLPFDCIDLHAKKYAEQLLANGKS